MFVPGGTTEVVYDHVIDAGHNDVPFLIVLTIDDGVLSEHYYWEGTGWKDIKMYRGYHLWQNQII